MQEDALILRPLEGRDFEFERLDISLKGDLNGPDEVVLADLRNGQAHLLTHAQQSQLINDFLAPVFAQLGL
jgi:hypothetical protein